jgi:hypothetical protein
MLKILGVNPITIERFFNPGHKERMIRFMNEPVEIRFICYIIINKPEDYIAAIEAYLA